MLFASSSNPLLFLVSGLVYALAMPVRDLRRFATWLIDNLLPQWQAQVSKRRVAIIVLGSLLAEGFYALLFLLVFKFLSGQDNLNRLLDNYPAAFLAGALGGLLVLYQIYFSRKTA